MVPKESIVVTNRAPIGEVTQAAVDLCTNQGCKSLVIDSSGVMSRFIYYALSVNSEKLNAFGLGTTFMELSSYDLGMFELPHPSIQEQAQIAKFLDYKTNQIDRLIEKKKALIEKLNEYRTTLITATVTGKIDVRNIPIPEQGS